MKKRTLTLVLMLVVSLVSLVGLTACEVDTHEHTMQKTEAMAATCTETGNIEYYTCTDCGKLFADEKGETEITAESTVVAANGHTIVAANAKEATCTEAGNTAHYKCSVCGKLFSDENGTTEITAESTVIAANGHTIVAVNAKEATCTEAGNTAHYKCAVCEKHFSDENGTTEITAESTVVAANGHEMTHHEAVPATCTEDGTLEHYSCSVCEKNFEDENGTAELKSVVDTKKGHEMTRHEAVSATCTEDGNVEYYACSRCNKNFADENGTTELNEIIDPAKGHAYTFVPEVAKTCTTDGTKAHYVCNNESCGKKFILEGEEYKPATDLDLIIDFSHEMEKVEAKTETCTENGNTAYYACTACGKYFSDEAGNTEIEANSWVIPAHHTFEETLSNDETNHWYACKNCDEKKDETAHTYGDATFNAIGGSGTHTCTECEYEEEITDSNPNPDFTKNKYGATGRYTTDGAKWEPHPTVAKAFGDSGATVTDSHALEFVVPASGRTYEDYLPRINFAAFGKVTINVLFKNLQNADRIGLSLEGITAIANTVDSSVGDYQGTMSFVFDEGKLVQTLTITRGSYSKTLTKTITDEDIINGNKSAVVYFALNVQRSAYLSDFTFIAPCETHTYGTSMVYALGKTVQICAVCGHEFLNTEVGELDFTKNKYGATVYWSKDGSALAEHSTAAKNASESSNGIAKNELEYHVIAFRTDYDYLPKINFAAFTTVSMKLSFKAFKGEWKVGLEDSALGAFGDSAFSGDCEGTMTFTMQDGVLTQSLLVNGKTFTKTITDEDVINGNKSALLMCFNNITVQTRYVVSDFTFEK